MKPIHEVEKLDAESRRRFLKLVGLALAAPYVPSALRFAAEEVLVGKAHAQANAAQLPTNLIEIDLRDQWDQGHVMVAPGLATASNMRRGESGNRVALFFRGDELRQVGERVYLTDQSRVLEPHVDTIAMVDVCELAQGAIHGHESANPLRSPGRSYERRAGQLPMFENDPVSNFPQGCEAYYSSTPTPASLHNFFQKQLDPSLRNGVAFKGISRSIHTAYHFGAGLPGAELDRKQSVAALLEAFPSTVEELSVLPSAAHADALARVLERIDRRFLEKRRFSAGALEGHEANVAEARGLLHTGAQRIVSLPLTDEERAFWREGVPDQRCDRSQVKAEIWEQAAYAFKILQSGLGRTVALEFDYVDVHDVRTEDQVRTEAAQISLTVARLVQKLKESGLYDRTLIAVYTTDGSRSPAATSYGNEGKNTVILAGGMIRGGYYGDLRIAGDAGDGHRFAYLGPDESGVPREGHRVSGAAIWRTVMKALRIPDELCEQFPDVRGVRPLSFMLRDG